MREIEQHYGMLLEKDRLFQGLGLLEKERTQQIILRNIQGKKLDILDLGGAAGVYSFWLAKIGHRVHLVDLMPEHINQAKLIDEKQIHKLEGIKLADARDLSAFDSEKFDLILLFGPLYHLVEKDDRLKALKECFRVLKKKGRLLAAGINRYASLFDGLFRGLIDDPVFRDILKHDLQTGQHRNPTNHPEYFTTTIFQLPGEMEEEITISGFSVLDSSPVEGPIWMVKNFDEHWNDDNQKEYLLDLLSSIEKDKGLMNITHHYIVSAEK